MIHFPQIDQDNMAHDWYKGEVERRSSGVSISFYPLKVVACFEIHSFFSEYSLHVSHAPGPVVDIG